MDLCLNLGNNDRRWIAADWISNYCAVYSRIRYLNHFNILAKSNLRAKRITSILPSVRKCPETAKNWLGADRLREYIYGSIPFWKRAFSESILNVFWLSHSFPPFFNHFIPPNEPKWKNSMPKFLVWLIFYDFSKMTDFEPKMFQLLLILLLSHKSFQFDLLFLTF